MKLGPTLATGLLLLAAAPVAAGSDHEMLAAEQELKIARDHLQAAGTEYGGHRRAAIDHLDEALRELREGLKLSRGEGRGREPESRHPPREPGAEPDED